LNAIQTRGLCKDYQVPVKRPGLMGAFRHFLDGRTRTVRAVRDVSFDIGKGELVGFLGPNGAGKTTTLKMLSGLLYPTSGEVTVLGRVPSKRENDFLRRFSMVMGQRTQLWWDLPARETFTLNQKIYSIPEREFARRRDEVIALLELEELVDRPVKKLSLGERMKAELACAILHEPEVLLLDEPTLGLDIVMQEKLRRFILDYQRRTQCTILLTSHNMDDVEELCQRVMVINDGQLLYDGSLEKIVRSYAPDKLVVLGAARKLEAGQLSPYGEIVSLDGTSAKLLVPRQKVSQAVGEILSRLPIVDLAVEEMPVDHIIRKVFLKAASSGSGAAGRGLLEEEDGEERKEKDLHERSVP